MTRLSPKIQLSAAVLALVVAGAGAQQITERFAAEKEGLSLVAYRDGVDRWTICNGRAQGVRPGDTATPEQCREYLKTDVAERLAVTRRLVRVELPAPTLAAYAYTVYNMGQGNFSRNKSNILAAIRRGDGIAACDLLTVPQMRTSGGKDCAVRANNCYGVWVARQEARLLCRAGYGELPSGGAS
jgi:lysozyme